MPEITEDAAETAQQTPRRRPRSPGQVLLRQFLAPQGMSATKLATQMGVPVNRVTRIINGETAVSARTALLFAEHLNTTPEFWLDLQSAWSLHLALLAREQPPDDVDAD